jgi:tRNA (cmo5U34)-methyltransferase
LNGGWMTIDEFDDAASTFDVDFRIQRAKGVVDQLGKQIRLEPSMSVMDFGCGTGLVGFELLDRIGRLTLADTSPGMIEAASKKIPAAEADRVEMLLLDPERMVFPQHYDLIVTLMTLHHIPDAREIVRLLASSLTPGGILALADLDREDGSFHGTEAEVHRGFDRHEIKGVMANAGLEEIRDSTPWTMHREVEGVDREYPLFLITGRS